MWLRIRPPCAISLGKSIAVAFSNSRSPREYEFATDRCFGTPILAIAVLNMQHNAMPSTYLAGASRVIVPESGQGALGPALVPVGQAYVDYRSHPLFTERMERFLAALLG